MPDQARLKCMCGKKIHLHLNTDDLVLIRHLLMKELNDYAESERVEVYKKMMFKLLKKLPRPAKITVSKDI